MNVFAFFKFLARRRTVFILVFLLAWLILLDSLWLVPSRTRIRAAASELSMQVAENVGSNVSTSLEDILSRTQNASLDIQAEPERTQKTLARLLERNPSFINVILVDGNGAELYRAGTFTDADNTREYSKMSGVYLALAGSPSFSEVSAAPDGSPTSLVMFPVNADGAKRNILVAKVNLKHLVDIVGSPATGAWQIYITDQNGSEIIGTESSAGASKTNLLSRPIVQKVAVDGQIADGLAADDSYTNENGVRMFAVGRPIPIANWSLFVERPQNEAFKEDSLVLLLAGAILLLGFFAISVALWSYWRMAILNDQLSVQGKDLLEKNGQLQELDKIKTEFISVAAHQLRTPLSAIKWTLGMLIDEHAENLNPEQKSLLMKGFESNERIIKLINEMLVVTRIESGKIKLAFSPTHIEDLIESIVLDFTGQAYARKITLTFDAPKERLPFISADPDQIRNVIQNLIENAIRYTLEGGTIRLEVHVEGSMIKLSVADSGIGIPERQQSSIFNKFFRADNATRQQTDGTGLGLFISKSIAEKHGGRLSFTSAEGKGTTFYLTLPVSTASK